MAKIYKLQGSNLEFVASYMAANKKKSSNRWHIETSSKNTGEQLCAILQGVYPGFKRYDKGFGWGDFDMIFENSVKRDEAYEDCNAAVSAYRNDTSIYVPTETTGNNNTGVGSGDDNPKGMSEDYTTYIIIGAAVLLIFLLLKRKNKK